MTSKTTYETSPLTTGFLLANDLDVYRVKAARIYVDGVEAGFDYAVTWANGIIEYFDGCADGNDLRDRAAQSFYA